MLQRNFYQEHAAKKVYTRKPKTSSESSRFVAGSNRHERYNLFFGSEIFPLNAVFEASTSTGAESVGVGDATRCPLVKTQGFSVGSNFEVTGEGSTVEVCCSEAMEVFFNSSTSALDAGLREMRSSTKTSHDAGCKIVGISPKHFGS